MSDHKRPETIPGYVHPEGTVSHSRRDKGVYKTFTEGEDATGSETFSSTTTETQYATNADSDEDEDTTNLCPQCKTPAVFVCNCAYSDKRCKDGHTWYTDRSGTARCGNPHK